MTSLNASGTNAILNCSFEEPHRLINKVYFSMKRTIPKSLKNRKLTEVIIGSQNMTGSGSLNHMDDDDMSSDITDFSEMDDSYSTRSTQTIERRSLLKISYDQEGESEDEKEKFEKYTELWKYDQESFMTPWLKIAIQANLYL